ncbi:MAG: hypothetical protein CSA34_00935 [Desulfobulbus propionicus]|nr:MAG: hypothetical protein CSA34_00935 [Desulfobulbus propionicus]
MQQEDNNRRSFLKHLLAGSAVMTGTVLAARKTRAQQPVQRPTETLYTESEAFKRYYESLR